MELFATAVRHVFFYLNSRCLKANFKYLIVLKTVKVLLFWYRTVAFASI